MRRVSLGLGHLREYLRDLLERRVVARRFRKRAACGKLDELTVTTARHHVAFRCAGAMFFSSTDRGTRAHIHVVPPLSLSLSIYLSRASTSHSRKRGTHRASRWYLFLNTCCASTTRHTTTKSPFVDTWKFPLDR